MAVVPQTDAGDAAGANSYGTRVGFKAYHDDRGNTYGADNLVDQALIKSRDYMDSFYSFIGVKLTTTQGTQWPRKWNDAGDTLTGIPNEVLLAQYELALIALSRPLINIVPKVDATGGLVSKKTVKVDVIETSVEFVEPGTFGWSAVQTPEFALVRAILASAGLLEGGGSTELIR